VQGMLSPIVAAILMPLSSISVVVFATLSTNLLARRRGLLSAL
jgi:Cu+-exporting ATPase